MKSPAFKKDLGLSCREDFPIFKEKKGGRPLIYLDGAATSQKPQKVIDSLIHFYEKEYGTVHRAIYQLSAQATLQYNLAREKIRSFIKAKSSEEVIFTRGTTDSINLVARSFGSLLKANDEIILSEMEHHSNIVPWQMLAKEKNLILKYISVNDQAELNLEHFATLLTPRTKLVSLSYIANSTGTLNPIKTLVKMAHSVGAVFLVDAAQAAAHLPLDVVDLDCDFLAFSGHKMYGPTGVGVLYGKRELLDLMPPIQGGGDMVDIVTLKATTYQKAPLKFEAGTPMIAEVIGLKSAVEYIESIGQEVILEWELKLLEQASEKLSRISGLSIIGQAKEKGGILSFIVEGIHPLDLSTFLDLEAIAVRSGNLCAQPLMERFGLTGVCRLSFSVFNTPQEIDSVVSAIQKAIKCLK